MFSKFQFLTIGVRLLYILINVAVQFLGVRFLSKEEFGQLSVGRTLFQIYEYAHLGTRFSLDRYLPTSSLFKRSVLYSTSLVFTGISSLIISIVWLVMGYTQWYYLTFIVAGIFYSLLSLKKVYVRSIGDYKSFNNLTILIDLLTITLQFIALLALGFYGICLVVLVSYTLLFCVLNLSELLRTASIIKRSFARFKQAFLFLFKTGFFLLLNVLLIYMVNSADRLIIEDKLGILFLADYSFLGMFLTLFIMIPSLLVEVKISALMKDSTVKNHLKFTALVIGLVAVAVLGVNILLPYLMLAFPKYAHISGELRQISYVAVFAALVQCSNVYFQAKDLRRPLFFLNLIASTVYLARLFYLVSHNATLSDLVINKQSYYLIFLVAIGVYLVSKRRQININ